MEGGPIRQVLHSCATATHAVRMAIQRSQASVAELAEQYGVNQKTVRKWRSRASVEDAPMGPRSVHSAGLSAAEEAACVAFRKHTLVPLDDCLYALQASIPHLTRSSLHRPFQRHGMSRLPDTESGKPKKAFKVYPIGYFHIDIAEGRTEEGKLLMFVAIDRTSKAAFVQLHELANTKTDVAFLNDLVEAMPYTIHTVLTDNVLHSELLASSGRKASSRSFQIRVLKSITGWASATMEELAAIANTGSMRVDFAGPYRP